MNPRIDVARRHFRQASDRSMLSSRSIGYKIKSL